MDDKCCSTNLPDDCCSPGTPSKAPTAAPSQQPKAKGFLARFFEKLDKSLEKKSRQSGCCGTETNKSDSSCCS